MKKIRKTSELLWCLGTVLLAVGVAICGKADLGVSMIAAPSFIISEAIGGNVPFLTTGVISYIIQGLLLVLICLIIRRFDWRFLLTFLSAVVYGYTLDLFLWLLGDISFDTLALRWVMLVVGNSISAFGVACFFRTYLPLQVYELFVSEFSKKFSFSVNKVKWCFDVCIFLLAAVLAFSLFDDAKSFDWSTIGSHSFHNVGLGTLVTAVLNSPVITLSGKLIDKLSDHSPRFPKLQDRLKVE